ncbi:hypothetical protein PMI26_05701 [Pseudomonas sp. GM33]|uniref:hypothetical protein n=1 Tax=Pseudomonas sp. GM33 TaxID=1144329 RepID=UPI00026FF1F0|nr:hypothetical protein [Pseudomonas sp. GM33]EJM34494.1 hypothetical protein PMI26_05701 [Pseudomonas sp. GM33]
MSVVREIIDSFPLREDTQFVARKEALLFQGPEIQTMKLWTDHELLKVIHFPPVFSPEAFSPPRCVFEGSHLRVEWQKLSGRGMVYHRNVDCDELSFQIYGERTLFTELGTVELAPGDFSRIPVGISHDNFGREETHVLFYVTAPVTECEDPVRASEKIIPPYTGWPACASGAYGEVITQELGAVGTDVAAYLVDEELLLQGDPHDERSIQVLRADDTTCETIWLYRSDLVWIGSTTLKSEDGRTYRRHLCATEIQYQVSGQRTLVTQRGTVTLLPGDFIEIPQGCAFTSIAGEESKHISVLSALPTPTTAKHSRQAEPSSVEFLEAKRRTLNF